MYSESLMPDVRRTLRNADGQNDQNLIDLP